MKEDIVEEIEVVTIASDDEDNDPSLDEILNFKYDDDMERRTVDRQVRRLNLNLTKFF